MLRHNDDPKKRPGYSPGLAPIDDMPLEDRPRPAGVATPAREIVLDEQTVVGAPDPMPPGLLTLMRRVRPEAPPPIEPRQDRLRKVMLAGTVGAGLGVLLRAPGLSQVMSGAVQGLRTGYDANAARQVQRMRAYTDALRDYEGDEVATTNQERLSAHQQAQSADAYRRLRADTLADRDGERRWTVDREEEARRNALTDAERTRAERLQDRTADNETWMERETAQQKWEREMAEYKANIDRQNAAYEAALDRQTSAFESGLPSRSGGGRSAAEKPTQYAGLPDAQVEAQIRKIEGDSYVTPQALRVLSDLHTERARRAGTPAPAAQSGGASGPPRAPERPATALDAYRQQARYLDSAARRTYVASLVVAGKITRDQARDIAR